MEEHTCGILGWGMALCGLLSLVPFRLGRGWRTWPLYLMGVGLFIFLLSAPETSIMQAIMVSLMMFLWVNGMAKLGLMQLLLAYSGGSRRRMSALPQRRFQLLLSLPILASCLLWSSSMGIQWSTIADAYRIRPKNAVQSVQRTVAGNGALRLPTSKGLAVGG